MPKVIILVSLTFRSIVFLSTFSALEGTIFYGFTFNFFESSCEVHYKQHLVCCLSVNGAIIVRALEILL